MATLSAEERAKIVNELNRVAVGYLGYQKEKTAQAVGRRTSYGLKAGYATVGKTANHADRESAGTYHHLDLQIDDSHRTIIDHGSWRLRDQFLHDKGVRTLQELKKRAPV